MTEKRTLTWFGWVGLILSVLMLIGAIAGLAAPYLAPKWIELDLLSHFRQHFIGLVIVALLAVVLKRFWLPVMIAGVVATPFVIALLPSLEQRPEGARQVMDGEVPFKILTLNTWYRNADWPTLEAYLRKEDAEVVVMMEFGESKRPLLDKLKTLYPYRHDCITIKNCRLLLLSKKPFEAADHKTRWLGPPIIWARFGKDLGGLTVIGVHLSRPPTASTQFRQVQELAKETLKVGDPVVVAGDFNATEWSFVLDAFQEFSGLWRLTNEPTWPTFFFGFPQLGIDHIFISNGIRPLAFPRRGDHIGSDHLPMSAQLAVQSK